MLRKGNLVLCLAILLFPSQLLSLFQMSTEMLENPSIGVLLFLVGTPVVGWVSTEIMLPV